MSTREELRAAAREEVDQDPVPVQLKLRKWRDKKLYVLPLTVSAQEAMSKAASATVAAANAASPPTPEDAKKAQNTTAATMFAGILCTADKELVFDANDPADIALLATQPAPFARGIWAALAISNGDDIEELGNG